MIRLLFTGGGGAGNDAIHRLWGDRYDLHFVDASMDTISPSIPASKCHGIPFAIDEAYVEEMVALCREYYIDVLIPGVDEELQYMENISKEMPNMRILAPDPTYMTTMLDKGRAMHALSEKGVDVPYTVMLSDAESIRLPCIIKPREGRGSTKASFWG